MTDNVSQITCVFSFKAEAVYADKSANNGESVFTDFTVTEPWPKPLFYGNAIYN